MGTYKGMSSRVRASAPPIGGASFLDSLAVPAKPMVKPASKAAPKAAPKRAAKPVAKPVVKPAATPMAQPRGYSARNTGPTKASAPTASAPTARRGK